MEKLFTKIGAPSYLPTPTEVLDGVRWLRANPAIAAGVMVGLTSYSVAKYYEYGEDSEESDEDNDDNVADSPRATRDEIARSVTALHLGLLKIDTSKKDRRHSAYSSASTDSSFASSGGLRSRASSIFDKAYHEVLSTIALQQAQFANLFLSVISRSFISKSPLSIRCGLVYTKVNVHQESTAAIQFGDGSLLLLMLHQHILK
ncbi:hypothetical protein PRIC2_002882 [Phytophthora ramorum]